ncbi:ORF2 protein [Canna indica]|uniref:ORF2 protein n=1 Tax=Canna indica TaxID=4628 RepID=A0AAQ3L3R1_9LILI|nr:ORF2 protein [Canna indica]
MDNSIRIRRRFPNVRNLKKTIAKLNTLIQLTVKIKEQLDELKEEVRILKLAKDKANPQDLTASIESLAKDLQKLKIGEASTSKTKIPKAQGRLFVYKNPKDIFEQEKEKAKQR